MAVDDPRRKPTGGEPPAADLVIRARELQNEAQQTPEDPVAEARDVAKDLGIDPRYVDQAEKALTDEQADRERAKAAAREKLRGWARRAAIGAAVLALLVGSAGALGAAQVGSAAADAHRAECALDTVLTRQASLVPQLVALAGGDTGGLSELEQSLRTAPDLPARLRASESLAQAMATRIGSLPASSDPSTSQQRLNLSYEVTASQNRITTEERRYQEALSRWQERASRATGRTAVALRWAEAPPAR